METFWLVLAAMGIGAVLVKLPEWARDGRRRSAPADRPPDSGPGAAAGSGEGPATETAAPPGRRRKGTRSGRFPRASGPGYGPPAGGGPGPGPGLGGPPPRGSATPPPGLSVIRGSGRYEADDDDSIGEPPAKLGFGRLDSGSVKITPNGWSADYVMDGHLVHRMAGEGDRWCLECFHRGKQIGYITHHQSPGKATCHHFLMFDATQDPRAQDLAAKVSVEDNNVKMTRSAPRKTDGSVLFSTYPAGILWKLLIPASPETRPAWERFRRAAEGWSGFEPGRLTGVQQGFILTLDEDGRYESEAVDVLEVGADSVGLPEAVRQAVEAGAIGSGVQYRAEVMSLEDASQGVIFGFPSNLWATIVQCLRVPTEGDRGRRLDGRVELQRFRDQVHGSRRIVQILWSMMQKDFAEEDFLSAAYYARRVTVVDPTYAPAYVAWGANMAMAGNPGEARTALERALALDPTMEDARRMLADLDEG